MSAVTSPRSRRVLGLALGSLAFLGLAATASAATQTRVETGFTGGGINVFEPGSTTARWVGAGALHSTIGGVVTDALCVDLAHFYAGGTTQVDVTPRDMTAATNRAMAYVLRTATPTRWTAPATGPAATDQRKAQVAQVAMWVLSNQVRETNPTADAALNADVAALLERARAYAATPTQLALAAAAPAAGATSATVNVTGRPGASVDLTIPSGQGTLSAAHVLLDAKGTATVGLTRLTPGSATVTATSEGDGAVNDVTTPGATATQKTVMLRTNTVTGAATVSFTAPPVVYTTPSTPVTPVAPPPSTPSTPTVPTPPPAAPQTTPTTTASSTISTPPPAATVQSVTIAQVGLARLGVTKKGPARASSGRPVTYTITVTNRGNAAARNVVLRDILPSSMTVANASGARLQGRNVRWSIARLAPGATRRVTLTVRTAAGLAGERTNTAMATATGVRPVIATAKTVFTTIRPAAVTPAVTG